MLKKLWYLVPLVLVMLMGTNGASGAILHWTGAANDSRWENPNNWDASTVPAPGDDASPYHIAGKADANFTSLSSQDALCLLCLVENGANQAGVLNIDSGTMNVVSAVRASKNASGTNNSATVNMKGGSIILRGSLNGVAVTWGGCVGNSTTDGGFYWAPQTLDVNPGVWTMTGGLIDAGTFAIGGPLSTSSTMVFNLKGGTVKVRMPTSGYGNSIGGVGLSISDSYDGTYTVPGAPSDKRHGSSHHILNIEAGKLIASGDETALIAKYVDPCQIVIPYPNDSSSTYHKYIVYDYDDRTDSFTTVTAAKTALALAWKPSPIDTAGYAVQTPTLGWNVGHSGVKDCNTHDVYFGTSFASVNAASGQVAPAGGQYSRQNTGTASTGSYTVSGTLNLGQTYYWRVDELYPTLNKGDVWSFRVLGAPKSPTPSDGTAIVNTEPNTNVALSWLDSLAPTTHNLYISTNSASMGSPISVSGNSSIQSLSMNTKYYWRIDEVFPSATVSGDTWSFTTNIYRRSDDFERYTSGTIPTSAWSSRFFGNGASNGTINLTTTIPSLANVEMVAHTGLHCMKFDYNVNTSGTLPNAYQWVYKTLAAGGTQNWTAAGAKSLTIWMRGKANNQNPGTMKVRLEDNTHQGPWVTLDNVGTMLTSETWTEVNIDLSQLAGNGLSLGAVGYITIDIEDSLHTGQKIGTFYVDDIRLYPSRCTDVWNGIADPNKTKGIVDLSNDCLIGYDDLNVMSDFWLHGDADVMSDAVLHGGSRVAGVNGTNGVSLNDTAKDWIDIDDLAVGPLVNKTIMFWFKATSEPKPYAATFGGGGLSYLFGTSNEWRANVMLCAPTAAGGAIAVGERWGAAGQTPTISGLGTINLNEWHHVIMTFDSATPNTNTKAYLDGAINGSDGQPAHYYPYTSGICIGALNNGYSGFAGMVVDDFRIYNRLLDSTEIGNAAHFSSPGVPNPTYPSDNILVRYDFDDATFGTTSAQLGSVGRCYHGTGYVQIQAGTVSPFTPATKKYDVVDGVTYVSPGELYSGEAKATTEVSKRYVNMKDYALIAKYWMQTIPNWP